MYLNKCVCMYKKNNQNHWGKYMLWYVGLLVGNVFHSNRKDLGTKISIKNYDNLPFTPIEA